MERLTYWCDDGMGGGEYRVNENGAEYSGHFIDRLAAYEDTGLTPEEVESMMSMREIPPEIEYVIDKHASSAIEKLDSLLSREDNSDHVKDLLNAESEGRLLVLPCKVGDTVWSAKPFVDGKIRAGNIVEISVDSLGFCGFWASFCSEAIAAEFIKDDFGKTVFRTREEAEAALKERENDG